MAYISINFELYKEEDAKILVTDLALQRGYGIFDFLKTVNGQIIFATDHFNRFYNSAKELNLEIDFTKEELLNGINNLMGMNKTPNSGIKFILTGGYSEDGYSIAKPNLIITQTPFEVPKDNLNKGIKLVTYNHQRQLATVKTIDYLQAIRLQSYIKENGASDVLYHHNGSLRECPRANFFIVKGNEILTPSIDILKGVTRGKVLLFKDEAFTIKETDVTLADINEASEAFITSSTKNILPILSIDGKTIGYGKTGKITEIIHQKLIELIADNN